MTIIGLGQAGCNLAEAYEDLNDPTYQVKLIDSDIEGPNCFSVPQYNNPEECEDNFPDISDFLKDCHSSVTFFIGGGGNISAASLKILYHLRSRENVFVVYIRPEPLLVENVLHEKVVFNVLQEYARSGMFRALVLIDNLSIEEINGDVPVIDHFKEINKTIFQTMHGLSVSGMKTPIVSNFSKPKSISCITTYGAYTFEDDNEKLFYNLENIDWKCYYFFINEEQLRTDGKIYKEIKNRLKNKSVDNIKISYIIHSTKSEQNYCIMTAASSQIQKTDRRLYYENL